MPKHGEKYAKHPCALCGCPCDYRSKRCRRCGPKHTKRVYRNIRHWEDTPEGRRPRDPRMKRIVAAIAAGREAADIAKEFGIKRDRIKQIRRQAGIPALRYERHGKRRSPEYNIWAGIKNRCLNPRTPAYRNYGGRGIALDVSWLKFSQFLADVGPRPSPKHSIDRIDNNGHYEPRNVRWALPKEQCRNTRCNRLITAQGQTKTLSEWAEITGIRLGTLWARAKSGWDDNRIISQKLRRQTMGRVKVEKVDA